jgi:hypothetical protein
VGLAGQTPQNAAKYLCYFSRIDNFNKKISCWHDVCTTHNQKDHISGSGRIDMKTTIKALMVVLATTGTVWAASGAESEGNGLLVSMFLAFGALIIVFQLLPGLMLFGAMIKGLFIRTEKKIATGTSGNEAA